MPHAPLTSSSRHHDPVWQNTRRDKVRLSAKIPNGHYSWIKDKGSLTQKLIKKSSGKLRVEVLGQQIQAVRTSEKQTLGIKHGRHAVVREVILYGNNEPWVYARTVIPLNTLHGPLRHLHYLGNKPLGEKLFTDPTMKRGQIEVAVFSAQQLPEKLQKMEGDIWGRRSVFHLKGKPLLVAEVFLPTLFE